MKITAVCIGTPQSLPGRSTRTGIFKFATSAPVMVDREGLLGDAICNRKHHGGPDQAVYVLGSVDVAWWSEELLCGLEPGTFGENLVIEGIDSREISVGDRFATAEILLEATAARIPCGTFAARIGDPGFPRRFMQAARSGFYCRVLHEGSVRVGDIVDYRPFGGDPVRIPELMEAFARPISDEDRKRFLAAPLASRFRQMLIER